VPNGKSETIVKKQPNAACEVETHPFTAQIRGLWPLAVPAADEESPMTVMGI